MEYRTLGRTGLRVSELGMGTWQTFDVRGRAAVGHCGRIAGEALGLGVNFFDTAPMYGEAERVLGKALEGAGEALIATKVLEHSEAAARASIERSFKLLRTDVIDLVQIHNLASWRMAAEVLKSYQREGRIRYIGITDYSVAKYPAMIEAMRTGDFDTVQIPYNLGERTCRGEILPLARELGIGVIVMTPVAPLFGRNLLLGPLSRADLSFLEPYGVRTPGQALLKYLFSDPAVSTVIPATSKIERVAENAAVSTGEPFPPEICERLEELL
ncbi:MAG TPA: aldo/keto reductase [Nitrospinota bacterium]|jgi:aryl-alcohol dehydrogenase-like predicted oxidoreductase|nr:aldo/keto reductase [Nitrospinota bacterium]MDP7370360.1 aldo/keto reductase [Nitrospinota bacterium]MDP7502610.1 aldo/keto reductase [Nitrospinota bacterium]MDP7664352.1 aldo/keto reductase [Nitrospinota bacterium]HJP12862.1 aldo/keto reductase [Nitrospinota bacterium]